MGYTECIRVEIYHSIHKGSEVKHTLLHKLIEKVLLEEELLSLLKSYNVLICSVALTYQKGPLVPAKWRHHAIKRTRQIITFKLLFR